MAPGLEKFKIVVADEDDEDADEVDSLIGFLRGGVELFFTLFWTLNTTLAGLAGILDSGMAGGGIGPSEGNVTALQFESTLRVFGWVSRWSALSFGSHVE